MKTKPSNIINTPFPTFGEVFHFLLQAMGLPTINEAFPETQANKKYSKDLLRNWATEKDGPPSLTAMAEWLSESISRIPKNENLNFSLQMAWQAIFQIHQKHITESCVLNSRAETRSLNVLQNVTRAMKVLPLFQLQLRHFTNGGPILDSSLHKLVCSLWEDEAKYPLTLQCLKYYQDRIITTAVDEKTQRDWFPLNAEKTQPLPSFAALGLVFKDDKELTTIILNFAFARLLEQLTATLAQSAPKEEANAFYLNLKAQAKSLDPIYDLSCDNLDWEDYMERAPAKQSEHEALIHQFAEFDEIGIPYPAVDHLKCYKEYAMNYLQTKPMSGWESFIEEDRFLLQLSTLADPNLLTQHNQITQRLKRLKQDQPKWSKALAGPLHRIDARLKLVDTKLKPAKRIEAAMRSYRKSVETSIYAAGDETSTIIAEAMGFAALVYRHELKCGTQETGYLKPFLRKCFNHRFLLGENLRAFDNDQEEQQYYERMEQWFIEYLSPQLRKQLEGDIRNLEFTRTDFSSAVHFSDFETIDKLRKEPLSKRQKKPFSKTLVSREQTPLMEAIDRGQLEYAHELVATEEDLNFINSTGDTAVTKAFAQKDYPLVLKILQREHGPLVKIKGEEVEAPPITVETLLNLTEKLQNRSLQLTLSEGRVEILQELYQPAHSGRQPMNMGKLIAGTLTPLYYSVLCLGLIRGSAEDYLKNMHTGLPKTIAMNKLRPSLQMMTPRKMEIMKGVFEYSKTEANTTGIQECIDFLINECQVKLDTPNQYDHSALTFAVECGMHDIASKLLAAGASVNHRIDTGGTAICYAIKNNDLEMVKLLLEYEADTSFQVQELGCRIDQMPMSDEIGRLIQNTH